MSVAAPKRRVGRSNRYRQIVEILVRHGFGFVVGKTGWDNQRIAHLLRPDGAEAHVVGTPERLRLMIEDLGPTFIKLGQILSTRGDLLPASYRAELAKLQDSAPPVASEQIRATFAEEFGRSVDEAFSAFDMQPIAAASIGQAHAATLPDGSEVIVKLRRPHIIEDVEEDLRVLVDLSYLAARHWEMARYYDIVAIVAEFAQTLRAELDYLHEGRNLERIASNFADESSIHIPTIYWDLTTTRVLTLERIRGVKITNVAELDAQGCDRGVIARRATRILLTMILRDGFFHADPHAGNVFVERDGRIGLIDFGMVGEVDRSSQDGLMKLMLGITQQDASRLADTMLDLSAGRTPVDRNALRRDLQRLLARYSNRPISDVRFGAFISEMIEVLRTHRLRLPPDLALLLKTIVMGEGLAEEIDPTFNLMEVYIPLTEEVIRERFSVSGWTKQLLLSGIDSLESTLEIPQRLRHILGDIERGGFEVNIQPSSFDPYFSRLERLVNHILIALLAVSCTISTAFIVAAYHPTGLLTLAEFLFFGALLLSGVFGLYILYVLFSTRRRKL
ncbi:MAG TPA: AarF/ABC1/UbiB kinase family protein [Ktedonobacterales bacterium]|nr:AarF/ABC1/UbiB kinase family protein [Ktedonobacterales bacterium]